MIVGFKQHDSILLARSQMITMILHLKVGENLSNAKVATDKAYSCNDYVSPQYTEVELTSVLPEDRLAMKQTNRNYNKLRQ